MASLGKVWGFHHVAVSGAVKLRSSKIKEVARM